MNFKVEETSFNKRLDKYLSEKCPDKSRTFLAKLIDEGEVKVNGKIVKASYKLSLNDEVSVTIPEDKPLPKAAIAQGSVLVAV